MSRNVFLSFLGKTAYTPTRYVSQVGEEDTVKPLHFVQETIAHNYCQQYGLEDQIYILTTQGALHNWNETEHADWNGEPKYYEPLQSRLSKLNLQCAVKNVDIPDGKSTGEIWQIFDIVFALLQQGDRVILDITHGFRSLPMLNMVLISYAKLLKDIQVEGIYYGNIEAAYKKNDTFYAPLWDLKDFDTLTEWTSSATIFLRTGNARELSKLIDGLGLTGLREKLDEFTDITHLNRGVAIYNGKIMEELRQELVIDNLPDRAGISALKPIIAKIKDKFNGYTQESTHNGFIAVKWCINNGLYQQAVTLLEEFLTTFVMVEIGQSEAMQDYDKRSTVSAALGLGSSASFAFSNKTDLYEWQQQFVPVVRDLPYKKKLGNLIISLKNSLRNDVNHAGFRHNPGSASELKSSTESIYNRVRNLIFELKGVELPELAEK